MHFDLTLVMLVILFLIGGAIYSLIHGTLGVFVGILVPVVIAVIMLAVVTRETEGPKKKNRQ